MRRLISIILVLLPATLAKIEEADIIIITPIVLTIIGLLFFLGMYIRENYEELSKKFIILRKQKRPKLEEASRAGTDYNNEAKKIYEDIHKYPPEEVLTRISGITKEFLKEVLGTEKQFTHYELKANYKKAKEEWLNLSSRIEELKYSGEEIRTNQLKKLLEEFIRISKTRKRKLTKKEKTEKQRLETEVRVLSVLKRIFTKRKQGATFLDLIKYFFKRKGEPLKKKGSKVKAELKKEVEAEKNIVLSQVRGIENLIERVTQKIEKVFSIGKSSEIRKRINEANNMLGIQDLQNARKKYSEALRVYYKLPEKEQENMSEEISRLNKEIKDLKRNIERKKIAEMTGELEKIKEDHETYIIKTPKDLQKRYNIHQIPSKINKINEYADKMEGQGEHSYETGKKHLRNKLDELKNDITDIEGEAMHKLDKDQQRFIRRLKESLLKSGEHISIEPTTPRTKTEGQKIKDIIKNMKKQERPKTIAATPIERRLRAIKPEYSKRIEQLDREQEQILKRLESKTKSKPTGVESARISAY